MKYFKTQNLYKASNVKFNPSTVEAWSYDWWKFVGEVNGLVVFNTYRYSNSTVKHQWKVRRLMAELGITIDFEIETPLGLDGRNRRSHGYWLGVEPAQNPFEDCARILEQRADALLLEALKPRTHKAKNAEREKEYNALYQRARKVRVFAKRYAKDQVA